MGKTTYISLGCDCTVSLNMLRLGFRDQAMPLDWVGTYDMKTVCRLFETRFADFTKFEDLIYDPAGYESQAHHWLDYVVTNRPLGVIFGHDFKEGDLEGMGVTPESHAGVEKKYQRRIDRLYETLAEEDRQIVFCRKQMAETKDIPTFESILKELFPLLKYHICVYGFGGSGLEHVRDVGNVSYYRMLRKYGPEAWKDDPNWDKFAEVMKGRFGGDECS